MGLELLRGDAGDALEGGLEVGARGEAAVFGNGVVVPFRMQGELALGFLNAQIGEPGVEESLTGGLEPGGKEIARQVHVVGSGLDGDAAMQVASALYPAVDSGGDALQVLFVQFAAVVAATGSSLLLLVLTHGLLDLLQCIQMVTVETVAVEIDDGIADAEENGEGIDDEQWP